MIPSGPGSIVIVTSVPVLLPLSVLPVHLGRVCTQKKEVEEGRVFYSGLANLTIALVTLITSQSSGKFPLFSYPPSTE